MRCHLSISFIADRVLYTDQFSGPGRALGPVCLSVSKEMTLVAG